MDNNQKAYRKWLYWRNPEDSFDSLGPSWRYKDRPEPPQEWSENDPGYFDIKKAAKINKMGWRIQTNPDFYSFDPFLAAGSSPEEAIAITVRDVCDQNKKKLDAISENLYEPYASAIEKALAEGPDTNGYGGLTHLRGDVPARLDPRRIWNNSRKIYEGIGISLPQERFPTYEEAKPLFDIYKVLKYFIEANIVVNTGSDDEAPAEGYSYYYIPDNFEEIASKIQEDPERFASRNDASIFARTKDKFDIHYPDYYNGGQKNFTGIYGFYKAICEKIKEDPAYLMSDDRDQRGHSVYLPNFASAERILAEMFKFQFITNKFRIENRNENGKLKPFKFNLKDIPSLLPLPSSPSTTTGPFAARPSLFRDLQIMREMQSLSSKEYPQGIIRGFFNDKVIKNTMLYIDYGKDLELPEEISNNGYYAKLLTEPVDLLYNGWAMGHCIGSDDKYGNTLDAGNGFAIEIGKDGASKGSAYYFGKSDGEVLSFSEDIKNSVSPKEYNLMEFFGPSNHEPIPIVKRILRFLDKEYDGEKYGHIQSIETETRFQDEIDINFLDGDFLYQEHIPPADMQDLQDWAPHYRRSDVQSSINFIKEGIALSKSEEYQDYGEVEEDEEGNNVQVRLRPTDITDAVSQAIFDAGRDAAKRFFAEPLDFNEAYDKNKIEQYFLEFDNAFEPPYIGWIELFLHFSKDSPSAPKFFNDVANALYMTYQKLPKEYEAAGKFREDLNLLSVGVDDIKTENNLNAMAMLFASNVLSEDVDDYSDLILKKIQSARSQQEVISILNGMSIEKQNINKFFSLVEEYSYLESQEEKPETPIQNNKLFDTIRYFDWGTPDLPATQRIKNEFQYYDYHGSISEFIDNAYQNDIIDANLHANLLDIAAVPSHRTAMFNLVNRINTKLKSGGFSENEVEQLKNLFSPYYLFNGSEFLTNKPMVGDSGSELVDSSGVWMQKVFESAKKEPWEIVLDGDMGYDIVGAFESWKEAHKSVESWLKDLSRGKLNPKEQDNTNISEDAKQQDAWALEDIKKAVEDERWSFHFCHDDHSYVLCLQPVGYKED